jgi:hypothetical protein
MRRFYRAAAPSEKFFFVKVSQYHFVRESKLGQWARYNHCFARRFFDNSTLCVPSGPSARTAAPGFGAHG